MKHPYDRCLIRRNEKWAYLLTVTESTTDRGPSRLSLGIDRGPELELDGSEIHTSSRHSQEVQALEHHMAGPETFVSGERWVRVTETSHTRQRRRRVLEQETIDKIGELKRTGSSSEDFGESCACCLLAVAKCRNRPNAVSYQPLSISNAESQRRLPKLVCNTKYWHVIPSADVGPMTRERMLDE